MPVEKLYKDTVIGTCTQMNQGHIVGNANKDQICNSMSFLILRLASSFMVWDMKCLRDTKCSLIIFIAYDERCTSEASDAKWLCIAYIVWICCLFPNLDLLILDTQEGKWNNTKN